MSTNCLRLAPNLCPSLTEEIYDKLVNENITNSIDLLSRNAEELSAKTRISYKVIQNICKVLSAYHGAFQVSGLDLYNEAINTSVILSTGHECLDKLLGGGLLTEEIIEICGPPGVGKTHFCFSLSLQVALNQKRNVLYIDPTHSINSLLILARIGKLNCKDENFEVVLSRVHILHPNNIWELLQLLESVFKGEREEFAQNRKWDLLIIDSLPQLIYPLIGGSQYESFGILNHLGKMLMKVVKMQKMAAVVVNNAVRNSLDDSSLLPNFPLKPSLGRYWSHVPHTRLFMEREGGKTNVPGEVGSSSLSQNEENQGTLVYITKSTRLKNSSCLIEIL